MNTEEDESDGVYSVGLGPRRETEMAAKLTRCKKRSASGNYRCTREPGHAGAHSYSAPGSHAQAQEKRAAKQRKKNAFDDAEMNDDTVIHMQLQHTPPPDKAMITTVRYAQLYNTGNYENRRFEVEATVPAGVAAEDVLAELRTWVHAQHTSGGSIGNMSRVAAEKEDLSEDDAAAALEVLRRYIRENNSGDEADVLLGLVGSQIGVD